jgi:hypothetical protein
MNAAFSSSAILATVKSNKNRKKEINSDNRWEKGRFPEGVAA